MVYLRKTLWRLICLAGNGVLKLAPPSLASRHVRPIGLPADTILADYVNFQVEFFDEEGQLVAAGQELKCGYVLPRDRVSPMTNAYLLDPAKTLSTVIQYAVGDT